MIEGIDYPSEQQLAVWPNCSVPDCESKVCLGLSLDKCYPHATGRIPALPISFLDQLALDEEDDEEDDTPSHERQCHHR